MLEIRRKLWSWCSKANECWRRRWKKRWVIVPTEAARRGESLRGRTNPDGQGAGQSQPQLFFQE